MRIVPPEIKTITVNGVTTEYSLFGERGPVVILLHGFRMPMSSWGGLYPEIKKHGRIFAYNRHGVGKTSKATCPQAGDEVIRSLENLLMALNLSPPYILAAHSWGGLFANLYARLNPDDVAAVVFVDAAHPDEKRRQENYKPPRFLLLITGVLKAIDTRFDKYHHSEDDRVAETILQIEAAGSFPPIPVAGITGGKNMPFVPEVCFAIHRQCQIELAALSPHAVQLIANNSGHFPQISEPEIVVRTIEEIASNVKHGALA